MRKQARLEKLAQVKKAVRQQQLINGVEALYKRANRALQLGRGIVGVGTRLPGRVGQRARGLLEVGARRAPSQAALKRITDQPTLAEMQSVGQGILGERARQLLERIGLGTIGAGGAAAGTAGGYAAGRARGRRGADKA